MTSNNNNPPPKRQATIFGGIVSDDTQRQQQKRVRRTNDEIHRDNRKKKAGVASMARSLGSFVNRTSANIATAVINFIPWPTIRERDASFEATECNNDFDGNGDDQNPEDDSDEFEYCDGQGDGGGDDRISADEDRTTMGDYLQHIQTQIKEELNTKKDKNDVERWLIDYLKQNEFGIRKEASSYICGRLGIPHCIQGYYRDVIVWLPDIQFNEKPPCPCCKSSLSIGVHGYEKKTFARRIIGMNSNYFILSRRYICHDCKDTPGRQSTFHGYNPKSMERLPRCIALHFPAFLTRKLGMDKSLIDLMRPSMDSGMKINAFQGMIAELHAKEHLRLAILHEWEGVGKIQCDQKLKELFSPFDDESRYAGYVPSANWFRGVYKRFHRTIRDHMDNDVKKLGLLMMFVDVSYKAAKKIRNINLQPVVNGLVTIMNECNEIRSQFFVPTDAHDQYEAPLASMMETFQQYGHDGPKYAYTDNPSRDATFLLEHLPSLRAMQDEIDLKFNEANNNNARDESGVGVSTETPRNDDNERDESGAGVSTDNDDHSFESWFSSHCTYLDKKDAINLSASALLERLDDNESETTPYVLGLDAEWFVPTNAGGRPCGAPDKLAVIQLSMRLDGVIKVFIYHVYRLNTLPDNLISLLQHNSVRFTGCQVSGDLRKISRDFKISIDTKKCALNLGNMVATRGVTTNGRSLEAMSHSILGQSLDKGLQISNWNRFPLSPLQKQYAAKDAKNSLELYEYIDKLPDLTVPPSLSKISAGLEVDIAQYTGRVFNLGCCAATGVIAIDQKWDNQRNINIDGNIANGVKPGWYIVEVRKVYAPSVKVKNLKAKGSRKFITLGELGDGPFTIPIPYSMLRTHIPNRKRLLDSKQQQQSRARQMVTDAQQAQSNLSQIPTSFILQDSDDNIIDDAPADVTTGENTAPTGEIDPDASIQDPVQIAEIERCLRDALKYINMPGDEWIPRHGSCLSAPPDTIIVDKFSAILGSGFHACHRMVTPMHHSHKKGFFVALSEALYAWDDEDMNTLVSLLKTKLKMEENEIKTWRYFRRRYFARRVRRVCLPPSRLYWRVRGVFETFGPKTDSETGKPLFNKRTWTCAKGVLKEILAGYYSDPPGVSLYKYELTDSGDIKYDDKLGIPLITCSRDTNMVENSHKNLTKTFGSHSMGIEFGDCLLAERRHRVNARASRKHRSGYPNTATYDTWLIDALQNIVEQKHNILLYPNWVNSSDFATTNETFGFVGLASNELKGRINSLNLPDDLKLPPDIDFLSKSTGLKIAPVPWHTIEELKLFPKLLQHAQQKHGTNETAIVNEISLSILKHVDGKAIFPKLPVHIRLYLKRFTMGRRVKSAEKKMKSEIEALDELNNITKNSTQQYDDEQNDETSFEHTFENDDGDTLHNSEAHTLEETGNVNDTAHSIVSTLEQTTGTCTFGPINQTPPAKMPSMIPPIHPANFQPLSRPIFAAGFPLNIHSFLLSPQPSAPGSTISSPPRGKDKRKRTSVRKCRIFCGLVNCQGGKSGPTKGGVQRRCQFLPICLMNDLNEASSESEELIARGEQEDDGDDIIILVLSARDRQKRIRQLASFLDKLFQYSGKDYCDSEYSWKDFEVM